MWPHEVALVAIASVIVGVGGFGWFLWSLAKAIVWGR
jgi:hypothetical protein